jgi:hypothetical protein
LRVKVAVPVAHLRSGLFRAELADAIPAKHRGAGHGGFGVIEYFNRYLQPVGFDLIPQRVAAAAADQQQLAGFEVADFFQRLQIVRQLFG